MLKLFYSPTTAGIKVMILLEEIGQEYLAAPVNVMKGVNKYKTYLNLVPTGKIPAVMDDDKIFMESSNILLHLATKYGKLWDVNYINEIFTWLFFETSEVSARFLNHYRNKVNFPEHEKLLIKNLEDIEVSLGVLNKQLEGKEYIATKYSIVDVACFPWINFYVENKTIDIKKFNNLEKWYNLILTKNSVIKVLSLAKAFDWDSFLSEEELKKMILQ
jgi:GST-like protein